MGIRTPDHLHAIRTQPVADRGHMPPDQPIPWAHIARHPPTVAGRLLPSCSPLTRPELLLPEVREAAGAAASRVQHAATADTHIERQCRSCSSEPTIVLEHGAWADASALDPASSVSRRPRIARNCITESGRSSSATSGGLTQRELRKRPGADATYPVPPWPAHGTSERRCRQDRTWL
jgi:hypothetical protein